MTNKDNKGAVTMPPTIGAAIRCITSEPVPLLNIMGIKPAMVEMAVMATGRSDYPNQINNVLVFPGIFRGLLDAGATKVTEAMKLAAAAALADLGPRPTRDEIIPDPFGEGVSEAVSAAVLKLASP